MSNPSDKSSSPKPFLPVQTIVLAGIAWAVLALLFFMLFSTGQNRPTWYSYGTYIFEEVAYLGAAGLCFRNWKSPQIVSGRGVWLAIGLGMFFYFIGNLIFGVWELYFGLEPDISPADLFFIATYISLGWGMVLAVKSKRLNLEWKQWAIVAAIAAIGFAFAYIVTSPSIAKAQAAEPPAAITYIAQASPTTKAAPKSPAAQQTTKPKPTTSPAKPQPTPSAEATSTPAWLVQLDEQLRPLAGPVGLFYVGADVFLLIIATMLLLAFWGGRFSQSWRMIAAAALCLYIADMWFKWAESNIKDYQSGSLPEVAWVFSGVLFAIGAALEYDTSSRSRRAGGRRRP